MSDYPDKHKAKHRALNAYYGAAAIGRSLRHFLLGKGFRLCSSLTIIILLARQLPEREYATYIAFQALITLIQHLTASQSVMLRYIPELRATGNNVTAYRLLLNGMLFRIAVVACCIFVLVRFLPAVAEIFHLKAWLWLLPWYLGFSFIHILTLSLYQSLESLLWQKQAEYSLAIGSLSKLLAISIGAVLSDLNLAIVVGIEICSEGLTLGLLMYAGWRRWHKDQRRTQGDSSWLRQNRRRVARYGLWGFLLVQSRLLYGSAPNRLVTAHYLGTTELAILGLADSLTNLARRFMPTRLLVGLIRPVFMARFSSTGDFTQVARMADLVYRFNMLIFLLPVAILTTVGEPLFMWLMDSKYGAAALLFAGFLVLMIVESMHALVELLAQAVEKNEIFLASNLVQSASLFLAIPLFPILGIWALVGANIAGTVVANVIAIQWLKRCGFAFQLHRSYCLLIIVYGCVSAALGWQVMSSLQSPLLASLSILGTYCLFVVIKPPFSMEELALVKRISKIIPTS